MQLSDERKTTYLSHLNRNPFFPSKNNKSFDIYQNGKSVTMISIFFTILFTVKKNTMNKSEMNKTNANKKLSLNVIARV